MKNLINYVRTHLPALLPVIGAVYAALVGAGVFSSNSKLVLAVTAILSALGVSVLHVRQQASLSSKK